MNVSLGLSAIALDLAFLLVKTKEEKELKSINFGIPWNTTEAQLWIVNIDMMSQWLALVSVVLAGPKYEF